jgi:diacylglycerol kinase (ATP)
MSKKFRPPGYHPIRKFKIILSGLYFAVVSDFSVAYKMILSIFVLGLSFIFREWIDFTLILLGTGLMLTAELFNSCIEALCDFMKEQLDERIRVIKDIAAAAAGISILVWATILIIELSHIWSSLRR